MSRPHGFPLATALLLAALLVVAGLTPAARAGDDPARSDLARRLEKLDASDATAAYKLALELEAAGANDLAGKAYEIVVGIDPEHRAARRALGYEKIGKLWYTGDALQRAKGFVHHEKRWMTAEEFAAATRPQREAKAQKAGESRVLGLLGMIASGDEAKITKAKRLMAMEPAKFKLAPLAKALRCEPASLRIYAAQELGRLADPLGVPALLKCATHDKQKPVRVASAEALREIGSPSTVHPLGRALDSRFREVRVNAAEALGILGDELAYPYIIKKWEGRSGNFPRSYFSTARQISYIQDFDVEVAQTSFIADPIVGVLSDGVVQSVKILATEQTFTTYERPAFNGALKSLAGTDLGNKVGAWKKFWHQNGKRLLDEREERYEQLAQARKAKAAAGE
ncbi:MAG: HEAT repeat domain-containing protein [Planctomycetota bacterium]|nr:HEAT repeat domain-containing protein [Planctomycetota bacterium]